jgi:Flp pilus assembly protein TadG
MRFVMRVCPEHRNEPRRGAAVVELAVILPLLAVLVVGTIELTRQIQVKHTLTDCARETCRRAILPNATNSGVTTNLSAILNANGIPPAHVTTTILVNGVNKSLSTAKAGDSITVSLSVPAAQVNWISVPMFTPNRITAESLVMMKQG